MANQRPDIVPDNLKKLGVTPEDMATVDPLGEDKPASESQTSSMENKTLDELDQHDRENLKFLIHRECKTYHFQNPDLARSAMNEALRLALLRFGIEIDGTQEVAMIDRLLQVRGVRVEPRFFYPAGDDHWRNGIYVYRHNEIAYWISMIIPKKSAIGAIEFMIHTNVDVFSSPRFHMILGGQTVVMPQGLNTLKKPGTKGSN